MNLTFKTELLRKLATGEDVRTKFSKSVIAAYRTKVASIVAAEDERELRAIGSNHFEKLTGDLLGSYSIRVNKQFRIVFEIVSGSPKNTIHITDLTDYH